MRLVIAAPVDQGAETGDHLDHRAFKVLTKRIGGEVDIRHLVRCIQKLIRPRFSGEVDIGLKAEVKYILIFAEDIRADLFRLLHERHVA